MINYVPKITKVRRRNLLWDTYSKELFTQASVICRRPECKPMNIILNINDEDTTIEKRLFQNSEVAFFFIPLLKRLLN